MSTKPVSFGPLSRKWVGFNHDISRNSCIFPSYSDFAFFLWISRHWTTLQALLFFTTYFTNDISTWSRIYALYSHYGFHLVFPPGRPRLHSIPQERWGYPDSQKLIFFWFTYHDQHLFCFGELGTALLLFFWLTRLSGRQRVACFSFFLLHIDFRIRFGWVGPEKLLFGKEDLGIDLGEAGWDLLCIAFGLRRGWVGLGIGRFSTLVLVRGDLHAYILHGRMHAVCEIEREDLSTWGEDTF